MAKGLSELQKTMLRMGYVNEKDDAGPFAVYLHEVFCFFYGWEREPDSTFWPEGIGLKAYNAARVAVSKACKRLESRGLVRLVLSECGQVRAFRLTEAAIALIKAGFSPLSATNIDKAEPIRLQNRKTLDALLAAMADLSVRTLQKCAFIIRYGSEEIKKLCDENKITVHRGYEITRREKNRRECEVVQQYLKELDDNPGSHRA